MVEKIEGWVDTCDRFVVFIDIMGTKDRLIRKGHDEALKAHESLLHTKEMVEIITHISLNERKMADLKPIMFSDSLVLTSKDVQEQTIVDMFAILKFIFHSAFMSSLPIKGAIAFGKMTANEKVHFGQPLIDAVELQNELLLYGLVLHDTAEDTIGKMKMINDLDITKVKVPMRSGNIYHYLLDWTTNLEATDTNPYDLVSSLYTGVSGKPRIYVDNTLDFIMRVKEEKDKKEATNQKPT